MKILITGMAGFIGNALAPVLARRGHSIAGIDNINAYYDPRLKVDRLRRLGFEFHGCRRTEAMPLTGYFTSPVDVTDVTYGETVRSALFPDMTFTRLDITDADNLLTFYREGKFDVVVNLAAQAGVRYSIENPMAYIQSNIVGFANLLECARLNPPSHFIYASSSSVYGGNTKVPFSETDRVDSPVSLYAATKKSDELIAGVYSRTYGIKTTGLRFFTVYGPWGRPDMAPSLFADAILAGKPIKVFNNGNMSRDFTYIDDIVEALAAIVEQGHKGGDNTVYNIGCGHPESLGDFITLLETALGKKAEKTMMPMQKSDVVTTWADTSALRRDYGMAPAVSLEKGIKHFAEWRLGRNS